MRKIDEAINLINLHLLGFWVSCFSFAASSTCKLRDASSPTFLQTACSHSPPSLHSLGTFIARSFLVLKSADVSDFSSFNLLFRFKFLIFLNHTHFYLPYFFTKVIQKNLFNIQTCFDSPHRLQHAHHPHYPVDVEAMVNHKGDFRVGTFMVGLFETQTLRENLVKKHWLGMDNLKSW